MLLVVDNDRQIERLLRAEGYAVEHADGGTEALQKLGRGLRPSAILLDLDDTELRDALQKDAGFRTIPLILVSSGAYLGTVSQALGVAGCLKKPVDAAELRAVVGRVTGPPPP